MDRQAIITELTGIILGHLKTKGLELVDLDYRYEGRDLFFRILADRPEGGITLGECSRLNKEIGEILDAKDVILGKYILEVFSPGIDRPLKARSDFLRCINRNARFFLSDSINGKIEWEGLIAKVEGDNIYITADADIIEIPLHKINMAKQVIK